MSFGGELRLALATQPSVDNTIKKFLNTISCKFDELIIRCLATLWAD